MKTILKILQILLKDLLLNVLKSASITSIFVVFVRNLPSKIGSNK
jgi:hypothetical protein